MQLVLHILPDVYVRYAPPRWPTLTSPCHPRDISRASHFIRTVINHRRNNVAVWNTGTEEESESCQGPLAHGRSLPPTPTLLLDPLCLLERKRWCQKKEKNKKKLPLGQCTSSNLHTELIIKHNVFDSFVTESNPPALIGLTPGPHEGLRCGYSK
ncbi:hypothetical protein NQZ68_017427 [Dissostichus eleginoides]|nr:hypothetical protein NQZ68_017427 [Dissostichus eleginoides]